uniref:Ig-like domain-containing protein n=1 Tax=Oreochromis aureus TaxID=47969 RepID=A0AAZ1X488_OREAU
MHRKGWARIPEVTEVSLLFFASALQQDVQVKLGDDVTLQCQISTEEIISVLKWSRADLNTDGYVYFYRNKLKLRDPEMKDGDVSLILKNVTFNDTGIYECHIAVRNPVRSKRAHTEISHFIHLTVTGEFVELTLSADINSFYKMYVYTDLNKFVRPHHKNRKHTQHFNTDSVNSQKKYSSD